MPIALVVPAAGTGQRFGGDRPKQLSLLQGRPLLDWVLDAYAPLVDEIVLVVSPQTRSAIASLVARRSADPPTRLVDGGPHRQASVHAGLLATDPGSERILVHDAARPLISPAEIAAVIAALDEVPAALLALPCTDTVKRSDAHGQVVATEDRERLWLAQTPQAFHRHIGLAAFAAAAARDQVATDDVALLEAEGIPVRLVPGSRRNLKITTPEDLLLAEALLRSTAGGVGVDSAP